MYYKARGLSFLELTPIRTLTIISLYLIGGLCDYDSFSGDYKNFIGDAHVTPASGFIQVDGPVHLSFVIEFKPRLYYFTLVMVGY